VQKFSVNGDKVRKPALHLSDIVRKKSALYCRAGISARAAICSNVLSGQAPEAAKRRAEGAGLDSESADRAIMDVAEIGHCLRDRVPNFTDKDPRLGGGPQPRRRIGTTLDLAAMPSVGKCARMVSAT
jgi:hypothetical protein